MCHSRWIGERRSWWSYITQRERTSVTEIYPSNDSELKTTPVWNKLYNRCPLYCRICQSEVGVDLCPSSGFKATNNLRTGQHQHKGRRGGEAGHNEVHCEFQSACSSVKLEKKTQNKSSTPERGSYANVRTKHFFSALLYMHVMSNWQWSHPLWC